MSKFYEALGVSQDASADEIRKSYRKLAMKMHPDKGGDEEKFKELSHAYEVLSDDKKRAMYDQLGDANYNEAVKGGGGGPGGHGHAAPDIFQHMFHNFSPFGFHGMPGMPGMPGHGGQPGPQNTRRNDHMHNISISMEQAFHGTSKTMKINVRKPCLSCVSVCNTCQGRGMIMDMQRMGIFTTTTQRPCHICHGSGKQSNKNTGCTTCKGAGFTQNESVQDVKIPAGVHSGFQIRLGGLGEQAQNEGETPGDMIIQVQVEDHPVFTRTGHGGRDLVCKQNITFIETIVGKEIVIPHFAGEVRIDSGSFGVIIPNKAYIVKGKGMPGGDLHIIFDIAYPKSTLKDQDRAFLREVLQRCDALRV
jgi:DnaJ-class molecular chaperone